MNVTLAPSPKLLGKRLRELRKARNLTQVQVAQALGVSHALVSMWERGDRLPSVAQLDALSKLFWVDREALLGGEEKPTLSFGKEQAFLTPKDRMEVARWLDFVEGVAEAGLESQAALRRLRVGGPVRDGRMAPGLASRVREKLGLGTRIPLGLPSLMGLLDEWGVLVYRSPLEGILGGIYQSPQGGLALLVNGSLPPGIQALILAQGVAHFLYHPTISRALYPQGSGKGFRSPWFKFARIWGAYFLLPREALLDTFTGRKVGGEEIFLLAHRWGLDEAFVLHRLWMDGFPLEGNTLLFPSEPQRALQVLGLPCIPETPHPLGLERYSPGTLLALRKRVLSEDLSPKEGASLLDVDTTTFSHLLFPAAEARPQGLDLLEQILSFRLPGRKALKRG